MEHRLHIGFIGGQLKQSTFDKEIQVQVLICHPTPEMKGSTPFPATKVNIYAMKNIECKYCHQVFETDGSRSQLGKVAAHMRTCLHNPNRQKNIEAQKRGSMIMNRKVNERQYKEKILNDATRKERQFHCKKCGTLYTLILSDRDYKRFTEGKGKYKRYCSDCAHSIGGIAAAAKRRGISVECCIKQQKRKHNGRILIRGASKEPKIYFFTTCLVCKKVFLKIGRSKYCSKRCQDEFHKNRSKYLSAETKQKLSDAGKRSAAKQFRQRRSKCEIAFYELCQKSFAHVDHNKSVFNGWDADILLPDIKVAVLWNGPWHYKPISKRACASLAAIQNRDKIKYHEIKKAGWSLYVIKDSDSRRSKDEKRRRLFVEEHFKRFMFFIETRHEQFYEEFEL